MKLAFALLMLLAVVFSMPQKRLLLDTLLATDELKKLVNDIFSSLGGNATEQACETECHTLIQHDHLLQFGCPLVCKKTRYLDVLFKKSELGIGTWRSPDVVDLRQ
ncbi:Hypothetical predicted protein [Mytilus galloprovincialis]|uniref:Uncharacterized protein n=1 Tax=Mytilus galloprovincialis TaxID=29158 RepID=A0A8B6FGK0_MYTGA|nr:Hypothetical predicted protein [Mytilus galloprovincialis]